MTLLNWILGFFGLTALNEAAIRADERRRVADFIAETVPIYDVMYAHSGASLFSLASQVTQLHAKDIRNWNGVLNPDPQGAAKAFEARLKAELVQSGKRGLDA